LPGWTDDEALMMEAVSTSDTSVNFYQTTQRNIPEDSHLFIFAAVKTLNLTHQGKVVSGTC
jgi:hypothetical protein